MSCLFVLNRRQGEPTVPSIPSDPTIFSPEADSALHGKQKRLPANREAF